MSRTIKNQAQILAKLGIKQLNPMQEQALLTIPAYPSTILLSPTGTGKTLAFLLPVLNLLKPKLKEVQLLIIVPSRELAIQIEQVIRDMGTGFKANAVYGGRPISKDKIELAHTPAILIGTPGRVLDHLDRESFFIDDLNTIVLDEFDKSLEIGFEREMGDIMDILVNVKKRVLTSATQNIKIPDFARVKNPKVIDYTAAGIQELAIKKVISSEKDKLKTLVELLKHIGNQPGIIFCNFKDTINFVSEHLSRQNIEHGLFYGGLEQQERERALIKFRNGTHQIIIATDLAARGLDIPELKYIIHYQLPLKAEEFTHRNGRTARMNASGTAYVLQWNKETVPDFITTDDVLIPENTTHNLETEWVTVFISGGRKDKISKGDIAGLFFKQGGLNKNQLGVIELKQDCAFVAVPKNKLYDVIEKTNNTRLKKKKVRIYAL
ncbi:DEAD/DEAH box helicase [Nonlabens mediterrranea]|uniref:DEAD/DEAH box helicase n=2 Tax=Nonlabens mediterrranea TaxID=1419947 RepID=A0ABS0A2V0_9FLAO|nr:DEAD/DEAH box helicase [Nonlabens mediterrranea]